MARTFDDKPAVLSRVPLLIGLVGPSSSGKTLSALLLGEGIRKVTGGDVYGIDTESRRMLHYAPQHQFRHIDFQEPFGSIDYLEAIRHCVKKGASVVIVDSMSHEHEGPGGLIDFQAKELARLGGDQKMSMLAWQKPKAARRALINGLLQLNANFIFCFRAREKTKPIKVKEKTEIVPMGFMPIAGEEFLFEMTVNCLLMPKSMGVPTWESEHIGEKGVMKKPRYLANLFQDGKPLSEEIGVQLAEWAGGKTQPKTSTSAETTTPELRDAYLQYVDDTIRDATDPQELLAWWNSDQQKKQRRQHQLTQEQSDVFKARVLARVEALKATSSTRPPANLNNEMPAVGELFGQKDQK